MAESILIELTDWSGERDDEEIDVLRRATEASSVDSLAALFTDDHEWLARSTEPLENADFYASRGIPLDQVVRNIHAGQGFLTDELLSAVDAAVPGDERLSAARSLTRDVSESWTGLVQAVSKRYSEEVQRRQVSTSGRVSEALALVLAGAEVTSSVRGALDYDLEQWHTGFILWLEGADPDTFRHFDFGKVAEQVARLTHATGGSLVHNESIRHVALWVGSQRPLALTTLEQFGAWPPNLRIAAGTRRKGPRGFGRTHREALASERVARVAYQRALLTAYEDVELLSLLLEDPERATAFVHRTLGHDLSTNSERSLELRRTMMLYLDHQGSLMRTAEVLHAHRNTVAYRIRQINESLPQTVPSYRLRCALELAEVVPDVVLLDPAPQNAANGFREDLKTLA
ncbi:PucR family transcriptional regulator [Arthrobacter sp. JSM 101049]|uniref:PucR family transcriptional regulator n=1 Tax=Arthrobacter sp. JSM 101049 TaxID=929097 RepID=UPI00356335EF